MHSFIELAYKLINIVKRFWVCLYIPSDKAMWYFRAVCMHEYACERQINEAVGLYISCVFTYVKMCYCYFSSVQSLSSVWIFATPWAAARQASLSITTSWSLLKPMSIKLVMASKHLILFHPLLLQPSIFPSIRAFSNESILIKWPKYWSCRFSISPSYEYSGLISFRIDWLDLRAVHGTLKSLLQHHSSKAPVLLT